MRAPSRRLIAAAASLGMAVPLALSLTGSSQAAPTLTIVQAQAQLAALQTQEGAAAEAYDAGRIAVANATRQAAVASHQAAAAGARLQTMERGIAAFAVSTYTNGGLDAVDAVLGGGDPSTLVRRAGALDQVARANAGKLRAIRAQEVTLTAAQKVAADQQTAAATTAKQLAAAKTHIDQVIAQEQQVLSHLQAQQRQALLAEQARQQAASRDAARAALAQVTQVSSPMHAAAAAAPATAAAATPVQAAGNAAQIAVQAALSQQGKPYVYGAAGPNSYDCSGLVMWAYAHAGISLPHNAAAQYNAGTHIPPSQLQPGDIVFFNEGGTIGHNGIYIGGGKMVDANHTGGWVGVRPLYSGLIGGTRL